MSHEYRPMVPAAETRLPITIMKNFIFARLYFSYQIFFVFLTESIHKVYKVFGMTDSATMENDYAHDEEESTTESLQAPDLQRLFGIFLGFSKE